MRDGARAQAAIEVLEESAAHKRPPAQSLKDWALKHRFAGVKDRAAIGDIVFMALRRKASSAWVLGNDTPRAWVLGALRFGFALPLERLIEFPNIETHAYAPLSQDEINALGVLDLASAPNHVIGDYPEWLESEFETAFGDNRCSELAALAQTAPLDIRVNAKSAVRTDILAEIKTSPKLVVEPFLTPLSPWGIRIPWSLGKSFPFQNEPAFQLGKFEVQDEASQLIALLCAPKSGQKIADVCAGGGGKSLALAAPSDAKIIAYDEDANRVSPMFERIRRVGANNIEVLTPRKGEHPLKKYTQSCDIVLVDAPCTGSGTWRRAPDTKWRLSQQNLEKRCEDQQSALRLGAPLVKANGKLAYATCSIIPSENDGSIETFLKSNPLFKCVSIEKYLEDIGQTMLLQHVHKTKYGIQFTPLKSKTDGFYFAILEKRIDCDA